MITKATTTYTKTIKQQASIKNNHNLTSTTTKIKTIKQQATIKNRHNITLKTTTTTLTTTMQITNRNLGSHNSQ